MSNVIVIVSSNVLWLEIDLELDKLMVSYEQHIKLIVLGMKFNCALMELSI